MNGKEYMTFEAILKGIFPEGTSFSKNPDRIGIELLVDCLKNPGVNLLNAEKTPEGFFNVYMPEQPVSGTFFGEIDDEVVLTISHHPKNVYYVSEIKNKTNKETYPIKGPLTFNLLSNL